MRLLFDQNLSARLVDLLSDLYPEATHVRGLGLDRATDEELWQAARSNRSVLVIKDVDLDDGARFQGPQPKVIRLAIGNGPTRSAEAILRSSQGALAVFAADARRLIVLHP